MKDAEGQRLRGMDRGERCALVISECQSAVIDPALALFTGLAQMAVERGMAQRISTLARECRAAGVPVIHCIVRLPASPEEMPSNSPLHSIMRRSPALRRNHPASDIHPDIEVDERDIVCVRTRGITAFHDTGLEATLRALRIETVLLAGVSTNIALPGACIEAVNRGFAVVVPEECTAGATPQTHRHAIEHLLPMLATVTSVDALERRLGERRRAS